MGEKLFPENQAGDSPPPMPKTTEPPVGWEHRELYDRVIETLSVLPSHFESELNITGVLATDLQTFNTSLGATIEQQVVGSLNEVRNLWDPNQDYARYRFVRQAQRFPDVILQASVPELDPPIIMGIELKGWYALSKEAEPSFRFKASPGVCAPQDLLVIYPWALSEVTSGTPQVFSPYVIGARTAAETRNWHWQHIMTGAIKDRSIRTPEGVGYYPPGRDESADEPAGDKGDNFGRFARVKIVKNDTRVKIMSEYIEGLFQETLAGIPLSAWQRFFQIFSEGKTEEERRSKLETGLRAIEKKHAPAGQELSERTTRQIFERIIEIVELSRKD